MPDPELRAGQVWRPTRGLWSQRKITSMDGLMVNYRRPDGVAMRSSIIDTYAWIRRTRAVLVEG